MFHAEAKGWGYVIEGDSLDIHWLMGFLRTKTRTQEDLEKAERLYNELLRVTRFE